MSLSSSQTPSSSDSDSESKPVRLVVVGPAASEFRPVATLDALSSQYHQFASATRTRYNHPIPHINAGKFDSDSASVQNQTQAPEGLPQWAASLECCAISIDDLNGDVLTALQLGLDIIHSVPATMVCLTDHDDHTNAMHVDPLEKVVPYQPFMLITNQHVPELPDIDTINAHDEKNKEKQPSLTVASTVLFRIHPYPAPYHTYISKVLSSKEAPSTETSSSSSSSYYQVFDSARIDPMYALHCSIFGRRLEAIHSVAENRSTPFFEFVGHDGRPTNAICAPAHLENILNPSACEVPLMPFVALTSIVREYMYRYFHHHFSKYSFDCSSWFSETEIDYFRSAIDSAAQNVLFDRYTFQYSPDPQRDPILAEANISIHVEKETINPHRCAFGSVHSPSSLMLAKVKDVLRIRNVPLCDDPCYALSGIAYDIPKDLFKVYYIVRFRNAPKHLIETVAQKYASGSLRDFALVSWSYPLRKGGEPVEEKLYVYSSGPQEVVTMVSNKRGILYQYDCFFADDELETQEYANGAPHAWYKKFNLNGQNVLDELSTLHILPDCIEYVNNDKFTLYIPLWC